MNSEELRKVRADVQERMKLGMQLAASKTQSFGSIAERIQFNLIEQRLVGKAGELLDHIEEQAKQIALLKASTKQYLRKAIWLDHPDRSLESAGIAAGKQLAREMPDIFEEGQA